MTSPFDDPDGNFTVLVNGAGQHSLWPASIPVPAGWRVDFGPADRATCLDHVTRSWRDMRPADTPAGP